MPLSLAGIDLEPIREDSGAYTLGRAVTATLRVSPGGNDRDGLSWTTAFNTIQAALDATSTSGNDCTLILISPNTTNYDIDTAGNPTWAANVILKGTHRNWTTIRNTHGSAASIMKLTGKSAVVDVNFNLGSGSGNGLIMTRGGARVYSTQFVGTSLTGAATALWLDADSRNYARIMDCNFLGHVTHMTGLLLDGMARSEIHRNSLMSCLTGIQIVHVNSDMNSFKDIMLHNCALGLDLDAGNEQMFDNIEFHGCTANVDDEVGDHYWTNILGAFPIDIEPNNLVGVQVNAGAANTYGGDTQIRAAVTSTVPFRIVGVHLEPSAGEWYQLRFSADAGATFYDILQFDATKREGIAALSGTEFIFNVGTRISASVKSESGGNNVKVWIEIQEI